MRSSPRIPGRSCARGKRRLGDDANVLGSYGEPTLFIRIERRDEFGAEDRMDVTHERPVINGDVWPWALLHHGASHSLTM